MTYEQVRAQCIRFWGMHPDTNGSIAELWAAVNARGSSSRRSMAEQSAYLLFGALAVYVDEHGDAASQGSAKENK